MRKNREIRSHLLIQAGILLAGVVGVVWKRELGVFWLLGMGIALVISNLVYTYLRYKKLEEITNYLYALQNGRQPLDIRDNTEGELSILKNEIYKMSLKLSHQAQLLQEDKMFLSDSISDISHQLKTPLTSMMVMADLLEQGMLPEEKRQEFIHNIQLGLERMQWLVQSLLKLSKLDAGAVQMKREEIPIQSVIKKAIQPLLIPMEIKGQTLQIKGAEEITFLGDELWMTEAISNIVKNCIEHTENEGTVQIICGKNNVYTSIVIEDNGVGIEKEELPHIFERFYRGKNSSSDSVGIGLALSKTIITRQKGTIAVESTKGKGTKFIIKLYSR